MVMYYSDQRQRFANYSLPTAQQFAKEAGLSLRVEHQGVYETPFMQKVRFTLEALQAADRVVYSDIDVLFRPGAGARLEDLFSGPFAMSVDSNGFCTGFMTALKTPEVERFLRIWWELGMRIDPNLTLYDQGTFKLLNENFQWVKDLVAVIPVTLVSNPECATPGAIAHHVWSRDERLERIENFSWGA